MKVDFVERKQSDFHSPTQGNGYSLFYFYPDDSPRPAGVETQMEVRFWYGQWFKTLVEERDGSVRGGELAAREEIMMALEDVKNVLIK